MKYKLAGLYFGYLLVVWTLYRLFIHQPEAIDEFLIKPLIWLTPLLLYFLPKNKLTLASLGFQTRNLLPTLFVSLGLGFVFMLISIVANYLKYHHTLIFSASLGADNLTTLVLLVLATSITEEVAFRGYLFQSLKLETSPLVAGLLTTLMWFLIHVPIVVFILKLNLLSSVLYLFLTVIYGAGALMAVGITENLLSPILMHLMWSLPIILYR